MKNQTVCVELSPVQSEVFNRLAQVASATPGEVILALACGRLETNLCRAADVDAELRYLLWAACHAGAVAANDDWGLSEWLPSASEAAEESEVHHA